MLECGFESRMGPESSGFSVWHFLKLVARGFLRVLRFPPLLHRFNGSAIRIKLVFQTPHWPYRAVPLRYWQSDNRISTAVLPHLRATQKGNLARPHSRSPQAVRKPEGHAMHCHLHRGDWSFHLTNEKKKK